MLQDLWTLPTTVFESLPQLCLLTLGIARTIDVSVCKGEVEHSLVVAHGKSCCLLAHFRIHHIDQLIARLISVDDERRHFETKIFFEILFRAKCELANS